MYRILTCLCLSILCVTGAAAQRAIWQPTPGTTWQWQLTDTINTTWDVQMYDIDLFDAPQATIDQLKTDGRIVICYFSAGSYEDWREDAADFPESVLGDPLDGWEGERWLDIRQIELLSPIMTARLDLAVTKGCDGVEPDNIDGYTNDTGFPLTYEDQLTYNLWLATEAHNRELSIGLKNDLDQIPDLVDAFDWALNEQCFQYDECDTLLPFIDAGKAVFGVEYEGDPAEYCPQAVAMGFSWLTKTLDLGDEPPNACNTSSLPDIPILINPPNNAVNQPYAPSFDWFGTNATLFKLTVKDAAGLKVIKGKYDPAEVCFVESCSVTPAGVTLKNRTGYTWKVIAKNAIGKTSSEVFTFAVEFPGKPQLISPADNEGIPTSPTIIWSQVDAATEYRIKFKRVDDGTKTITDWLAESAACTTECSHTFTDPLNTGSYLLWVEARQAGVKNKSKSVKITVTIQEA